MQPILISTSIALLLSSVAGAIELPLHGDSVVRFASAEEGASWVAAKDSHIRSLSRFDLQSRLETDREVSLDDFLKFASEQVRPWSAEDIERIKPVIESIRARLEPLKPVLPAKVFLVHTTGRVEANAAYCRGDAIVLPTKMARLPARRLERLLIHELFHIISRQHLPRRQRLYAIIGFQPCTEIAMPASLADRKITNPDAPTIDYFIEVAVDGKTFKTAPVLYASVDNYDPERGGSFFRYLVFRLLAVEQVAGEWRAVEREGRPLLIDPKTLASYYDQIGRNTNYIIHPDEILADNFVHLMMKDEKLASPRIIEEMRKVLLRKQ